MTIADEFHWLQNWIKTRLTQLPTKTFKEILEICPAPYENGVDTEGMFKDYNLSLEEKLVLFIALSPYMIPDFLVSTYDKQQYQNGMNNFPVFCDRSRSLVIPTVETAVFLLGGAHFRERRKYLAMLGGGSYLFKQSLLEVHENLGGMYFNHVYLTPGATAMSMLLNKGEDTPEFSHTFPAAMLDSNLKWEELVLEYDTKEQLQEIKKWLEYEEMVKTDEDLKKMFTTGYRCLFYGPPGTGKTIAAALIGKMTGRRVYRIDLSMVVSKYVGETEKNLSQVFNRADHGKWILFFDEADALFGKRGQTHNAHDRYANQEVSYLLQRFETYTGVAILATNYKDNIDKAFFRRFHNMINFKFPEAEERKRLWEVYLPKGYQFDSDINLTEIASSVKINGAAIHNAMRRSVMKAALRGDKVVSGADMYDSVKLELAKENKIL